MINKISSFDNSAQLKDYWHFYIMRNIADTMFSWMNKEEGRKVGDVYESVTEGLKNIYKQKLSHRAFPQSIWNFVGSI